MVMVSPSSHFRVDPPRKQANTGSNATVTLAIQRVMATFWVLTRSRSVHANLASAPGKPSGYENRPDLTRELGERSLKRALELFSADRILPRYKAVASACNCRRGSIPMLPWHCRNPCRAGRTVPYLQSAVENLKSQCRCSRSSTDRTEVS